MAIWIQLGVVVEAVKAQSSLLDALSHRYGLSFPGLLLARTAILKWRLPDSKSAVAPVVSSRFFVIMFSTAIKTTKKNEDDTLPRLGSVCS